MSKNYVNRINDEDIIDIMRSILCNDTAVVETFNENIIVKLMQIRNTPILKMKFNQETAYKLWRKKEK